VARGCLLIGTRASVVSIGTERMLMEFGKASLLQKARQQPDKVRQVMEKVRTDGLMPTLEAVRAKLDQPIPLGYSSAGTVLAVGEGVEGFTRGDRVVSNGPHAEVVCVPRNLCARIPDGVSFDYAAFTVVASIALQGIRLASPTLGECVTVSGLGLIGQLCVQLLRAQGCRVLGMDPDPAKCAAARGFGAETVDLSCGEDPVAAGTAFSRGRGVDAVIVTASTRSSDPMHQAAQMSRKRGRIVLVGVVGLELSRADFYEKELTFQVSCSYGPGRYDEAYEQKGQDYPIGHVRWTENRNFEAVLDLMARGALDVGALITHRVPFERALEGYGQGGALGIVLEYRGVGEQAAARTVRVRPDGADKPDKSDRSDAPTIGVIGAGSFAGQVLLPALKQTGARLKAICSSGGVTAAHLGRKFGFEQATTDAASVPADPDVNTVLITTRHDTHGRFVIEALRAGKRVYVEKPLCLTREELGAIEEAMAEADGPFLMVGFNRRFAPHAAKMRELLAGVREPKTLIMTVNAGAVATGHWTQDPGVGGGRIVGEGCHFIDLLRYMVGSPIIGVQAASADDATGAACEDRMTFTLEFTDGSLGTVHYFANGSKAFPKERLEVFCAGRVLQLDNWRRMRGYGWPGFGSMNLRRQDKGHAAEMRALVDAVRTGSPSPIGFEEIAEVTRVSFDVVEAARRTM
jgi:predicted dehydrogenase/threonine dehydrogenase-like Zn-dependent dehydrogenase